MGRLLDPHHLFVTVNMEASDITLNAFAKQYLLKLRACSPPHIIFAVISAKHGNRGYHFSSLVMVYEFRSLKQIVLKPLTAPKHYIYLIL